MTSELLQTRSVHIAHKTTWDLYPAFSKFQIEFDLPVCFQKLLIKVVSDYAPNWKHINTEVGPHAIFTRFREENVGKDTEL